MTTALSVGTSRKAPTPEPLSATLLDTITVKDGRVDSQNVEGVYNSLNCIPLPGITQMCLADPDDPTFVGFNLVDAVALVAELGFQCQTLGLDWNEVGTDFTRVLNMRESAAVEQTLMNLRFTGTSGGDAAVDLTPASGAVSPAVGLAILEGNAGLNYVGLPTLHLPRTIASLILGSAPSVVRSGNTLRTALGSKLVAGAGYEDNVGPTGAAPADGEMWIYGSGEVTAVRGPWIQQGAVMDRSTNLTTIHAQRPYVIDVDCYLTAVRVTISE